MQVPDADFGHLGMTREQAQGLLSGFDGTLVFPWNPAYDQDRKLANPGVRQAARSDRLLHLGT